MMGQSPQCYIPSFNEIGPPVPEKKIFEGFYHICRKIGQGHPKVMAYTNYDGPVPNATYQVSMKSVHRFQRRRFLKVFTIYGHGGHLGNVIFTFIQTFVSPT